MPTTFDPGLVTMAIALITLVGTVLGALLTGRLNVNITRVEKETPPYDELARRVSRLEVSDQAKSRLISAQQAYIAVLLIKWPADGTPPPPEPEDIVDWKNPAWQD